MFQVAKGFAADAKAKAEEMLGTGETFAPLLSPSGTVLSYITTDKSLLRIAWMKLEVEGTEFHVGLKARD